VLEASQIKRKPSRLSHEQIGVLLRTGCWKKDFEKARPCQQLKAWEQQTGHLLF